MDLTHVLRVLRERRRIIVSGTIAAVVLALLSYATPTMNGARPMLEPRGEETWRAEAVLFITQNGFPWGRAVPAYRPSDPRKGTPALQVGDQARFSGLAALYAELAASDLVRKIATRSAPLRAKITTEPVTYVSAQFSAPQVLPLIRISATAPTPAAARRGAKRTSDAFRTFIARQQRHAGIPESDRIVVSVAERPAKAELLVGRSKILPAFVFVAIMSLVLGLALVLDNLGYGFSYRRARPRRPSGQAEHASPVVAEPPVPHAVRRQLRS